MLARICTIIFLLLIATPIAAQETTISDDEVNAIAKQMYCPVCENIPLDVCPTAACSQWRGEIRAQLAEGRSSEEIIQDFVVRFGDRVVGTPQDPLLRALSLVTPWLIGLAAVISGLIILARWRQSQLIGRGVSPLDSPQTQPPASRTDSDYRARLEQDLKAKR